MNANGIGIDFCGLGQINQLKQVEQNLGILVDMGYKVVEIGLEQFNLIINGEIRQAEYQNFKAILNNFDLTYSVHGYIRLNLAYDERIELCRKIMNAQIEFCHGIGAKRLVIHSGLESLTTIRQGVRNTLLSDEELRQGEINEVVALKASGKIASDADVLICVENSDAHLWEINVIQQGGGKPSDLAKYHARLLLPKITKQLEEVDHPNVAMTLDFGHLFIASKVVGFEYFQAIKQAAPWIRHLHVSDNFGNLDRNVYHEPNRWAFAEADMHMPPGWGCIPLDTAIACLPDFSGYVILEMNEGFRDSFQNALLNTKKLFNVA
jgi:sugar phosphate isomerase/epimerase